FSWYHFGMTYQTLLFDLRDGIAFITINRPDKLNALNDQVVDELADAAERVATDDATKGAMLTGAGQKAFVAGGGAGGRAKQGQPAPPDPHGRHDRRPRGPSHRSRQSGSPGRRAARDDGASAAGYPRHGPARRAPRPGGRGPGAGDDVGRGTAARSQSLRPAGGDRGHEGRADGVP